MPTKLQTLTVRRTSYAGYNYENAGFRKNGFFKYNSTYNGDPAGGYIHMLTNIPSSNRAWYTIEAVGYNYGLSQDILCYWSFKPNIEVKGSRTPQTDGLRSNYNTSQGVFFNSGYVEIVGYSSTIYYIGFALNAYVGTNSAEAADPTSGYYVPDIQITASAFNQSGAAYY